MMKIFELEATLANCGLVIVLPDLPKKKRLPDISDQA